MYGPDVHRCRQGKRPSARNRGPLAASIRILTQVGMEAIATHERELTRHTLRQLDRLGGIKVYGSSDPERLDDRLGAE